MKTLRRNSEYWYFDNRSIWKRYRQWLIWFGGWEKANGAGWDIKKYNWNDPSPVSIFGHWCTYYGWGMQWRIKNGYLVWDWRHGTKVYCSTDSTPSGAYHWFIGWPKDISSPSPERPKE